MQPAFVSIMGIINLTPDSFFDGGKWINQDMIYEKIKKWVEKKLNQTFITINSEYLHCEFSTRWITE